MRPNFALKAIWNNLQNHNCDNEQYDVKVVTDLMYDRRKHVVSMFKEHLIWDDPAEFLIR
jgi:hypothetical protein